MSKLDKLKKELKDLLNTKEETINSMVKDMMDDLCDESTPDDIKLKQENRYRKVITRAIESTEKEYREEIESLSNK